MGALGQRLYNVTIDAESSMIRLSGSWVRTYNTQKTVGGTFWVANDTNATAVVEFQGVAIYFLASLEPLHLTTMAQLDSQAPYVLQLTTSDPSVLTDSSWQVRGSQAIWGWEGLDDGVHQLAISVVPGDITAIVDGFAITRVNSTFIQPTAPPAQTLAPDHRAQDSRKLLIIGVLVGVALIALSAALCLTVYLRRKSRSRSTARPKRTLVPDLDSDFAPVPKSSHAFSRSEDSLDPILDITSSPSAPPAPAKPSDFPSKEKSRMKYPLPVQLAYSENPGITFGLPPPGYYDNPRSKRICASTLTSRTRPSTIRFSDSVPLSPPPSFSSRLSGNPVHNAQHEYAPSRR
ncbi:hypothetical protein NP233_g4265 [Leucocoprinus birnbaumii]|uniref:Transmembrane protein n=1 Tax=Leucocoprinus birnbaumii TaxID=56174 RepID=A0AAD5VUZ3_9AGAR|nr:hypothetical protein NP233_g4265 [Leucocoprinus birnbaumii]